MKKELESSPKELNELVKECTEIHMLLQRKEQLPRKFTDEDRQRLKNFVSDLKRYMLAAEEEGAIFLDELNNSPYVVHTSDHQINTRDLRRCLKMLVTFRQKSYNKKS